MIKHLAILQRWEGEKQESLCMEYPISKEDECKNMILSLRKEAYKNKHKVLYRMVELDGEIQYDGKDIDDARKKKGTENVLFTNGLMIDL